MILIVSALALCLSMAACGGDTAKEDAASDVKAVELSTVRENIIEQLDVSEPFLLETEALMDLYGISNDTVAQSASFVTMSGTFPHEVILIEAVDENAVETIKARLQTRLDEVMIQSQTYDAENYALAQECEVTVDGLYLSLILSPDHGEIAAIYQQAIN